MRIEDFQYVDTAYGGAFNRNVVKKISDVSPDESMEDCFTSMFAFRKEFLDHVAVKGSVKGITDMVCWSPFLWFDIDSDNPEDATTWLTRLLGNIHQMDPELLKITRTYFSGNKGFHVGVPSEALGLTPDDQLPYIMQEMAREIAFGAQIDTAIYQRTRLWRIPGTRHSKSGLHKTLLTEGDILALKVDITSLSDKIEKPGLPCFAMAPPCSLSPAGTKLNEKIASRLANKRKSVEFMAKSRKESTIIRFIKPCINSLMTNETPEGNRNEIAIRIANDLRKRKLDQDDALEQMVAWNTEFCQPSLSDNELNTIVASAYSSDQLDYGCNDLILVDVCDHACPLKKPELPTVIHNDEKHYTSWRKIAEEVFGIRSESGKSHERQIRILEAVVNFLDDRGVFYRTAENKGFFFDNATKTLMRLDPDCMDITLLLGEVGLFKSETLFSYMANALEFHALKNGQLTTIYNTCFFNMAKKVLYMSYGETQVIKIAASSITQHDNGTDGVLFFKEAAIPPFLLGDKPEGLIKFRECVTDSINFIPSRMTVDQRKKSFEAWVLSMFFAELMPTKPILCFLGEKGSGKSTTLRKLAKLLYGLDRDVFMVPHNIADLELLMSSYHFLALDNLDSKMKGLNDALAACATGTQTGKRQLYTDATVHKMTVRCFVGITSRTPEFTRDDVADRLLLMHLDMLDREKFIPEHQIQQQIADNRDAILTELVYFCQRIVQTIIIMGDAPTQTSSRIADFGHFATIVANIEGGGAEEVKEWLKAMVDEQTDFALFDQPIFRLIELWLEIEGYTKQIVTPIELRKILRGISQKSKIKFPEGNDQRRFGQAMRHQMASLEEQFSMKTVYYANKCIKHYIFNPDDEPSMEAKFKGVAKANPENQLD